MVCVPCFIIPLLLYIWHKFIQPYVLRYWNPWEKKDEQGNVIKTGTEFPFECKGGVCPFVPGGGGGKQNKNPHQNQTDEDALVVDKDNDKAPVTATVESKKDN